MAALADQTVVADVQMDRSQSQREPSADTSSHDDSIATETADEPRADPDAQTTITDFLDFTEYLPADMTRSLTLIGKLDDAYANASIKVDELTKTWGQLPSLSASERPSPVQLRADISEQLNLAVSSRVYAHAEAVRMSESVDRQYNKAKLLLSKLQTMMDNYPTEEQLQLSPAVSRSPQMSRAKPAVRVGTDGGPKVRRPRIPRVTVPGEVLAPYDIEYDTQTGEEDVSSDDDDDTQSNGRRTPGPTQRIKIVSSQKSRSARPSRPPPPPPSAEAAANLAALLKPPPENAVIGSSDAPWLQLTQYELAKLRKRMKKNATWTPSETMIARELRALGRGPEDYIDAKKKAEDEGKAFEPTVPSAVVDDESGAQQMPAGAISAESVAAEEVPTVNRGMKLNEAKKLKREALAKQAAEEAEESARKMREAAQLWLGGRTPAMNADNAKESEKKPAKQRSSSRSQNKRKRDEKEASSEPPESVETPSRPQFKRTKTETPVPPPQHGNGAPPSDNPIPHVVAPSPVPAPHSETPVPIPMPRQGSATAAGPAKSPTPNAPPSQTVTTTVPTKPPAPETPVPLPKSDRRKSTTPIAPPTRELPNREGTKRETRGDAAKRSQQQLQPQPDTAVSPQTGPATLERPKRSVSRGLTPGATTPAPELPAVPAPRRPVSRGTAEPPPTSAANDRPRRASTARNTPAPEVRPPSRRTKRPAPGVVSTTSSGGNSAVGKRKAAPRKKARMTRKEKDQIEEVEMEDVDDEGNPIDPDEPRYCLCNRVSFGTMIQCDNVDVRACAPSSRPFVRKLTWKQNCKGEWFHLECVGMDDIPARTTKWYCPDCRRALKIGEKGEVSARGVRK